MGRSTAASDHTSDITDGLGRLLDDVVHVTAVGAVS